METSQILYKRMGKDIDLHSCAASARVEGNKNGRVQWPSNRDESRKSRCRVRKTDPGSSRRGCHLGKDENLQKPDNLLVVNSFVDSEIRPLKK